jgi:hypothetical protein
MHIHGQTLDRYRADALTPAEDAAVHRHIAICLPCARAVAAETMESVRWERRGILRSLVRIDGAPPARRLA